MELEDLKNTWNDANKASQQHDLTSRRIDDITQKKYSAKLSRVIYPELIGIIVCLFGASYIGFNFQWLDTVFLMAVGAVTILLLLAICSISLVSLQQIYQKPDVNKPYAETLKEFAMHKLQFHKLQKVNVTLCYLLLVGVVVLLSKIVNGIDISSNKYYWTFSFTIGYIFLLFYSRWVAKHYRNSLKAAEELLQEVK